METHLAYDTSRLRWQMPSLFGSNGRRHNKSVSAPMRWTRVNACKLMMMLGHSLIWQKHNTLGVGPDIGIIPLYLFWHSYYVNICIFVLHCLLIVYFVIILLQWFGFHLWIGIFWPNFSTLREVHSIKYHMVSRTHNMAAIIDGQYGDIRIMTIISINKRE